MKVFDEYISKTLGRKVALLLDNLSSHGRIEDVLSLSNVEVIYVPKKYYIFFITERDAGVIAFLKRKYRKKQYERALLLIENEKSKNLYEVNVSQAMKWISAIWDNIEIRIIHNCWEKIVYLILN